MRLKKLIRTLHLWLGLISGLLVFIIAVTGSLYAFKTEIENLTQPYRFVEEQNAAFLPPSRLIESASKVVTGKKVHAVMYQGREHSAKVIYWSNADPKYYNFAYLNPYNGEVLKVTDELSGFFSFILEGHFYLWLPDAIGQKVVAITTLVFTVMLVSGIILWWPRNRSGIKQKLSIRLKARWRRKNYDMHSVAGFYVSWLGIIFAVTGLVWGFEWFMHTYYSAITGGKTYVDYSNPSTNYALVENNASAVDRVWYIMNKEYPAAGSIEVHPPEDSIMSIAANANPDPGTYWKTDYRYFDQYTLKELPVQHIWGRFNEASAGDKLMRMNYDIHTGAVLGLPGKILAFCSSLLIASLPVTGVLLWWGRRNKSRQTYTGTSEAVKSVEEQLPV